MNSNGTEIHSGFCFFIFFTVTCMPYIIYVFSFLKHSMTFFARVYMRFLKILSFEIDLAESDVIPLVILFWKGAEFLAKCARLRCML